MVAVAEPHESAPESPRFIPVSRWNDYHLWPPPGGMRHLLFHRESNGLQESGAVIKVGKSLLIREDKWFEWLQAHSEAQR